MARPISGIAFTPAVKAAQQERGSRRSYSKMEQRGGWQDVITRELQEFIAERDSFYLGTASSDGQPYIQHRGGAKGFLKVLDEKTLAVADYAGNAQYISLGNLSENNKAFIFLMDYPHQLRIKIWGTAEFIENDPALLERVIEPDYPAKPQRVLVFRVKAWDLNCNRRMIYSNLSKTASPAFPAAAQMFLEQLRRPNGPGLISSRTIPYRAPRAWQAYGSLLPTGIRFSSFNQ
jgi:uncharacterized protein